MTRPGKSKSRHAGSKAASKAGAAPAAPGTLARAAQPAAVEPPMVQAALSASVGRLLGAPAESDLLTLFDGQVAEIAGDATSAADTHGIALALVEVLAATRDEAAAPILSAVATAAPDKELRKAARRALHKLRSAGLAVAVPVPAIEHAGTVGLARESLHLVRALVSATDGVGSRLLWLVFERPNWHGSFTIFNLAVNDIAGLKDMFIDDMSRRRFEARLEEWQDDAELDAVEVPTDYGLALLAEALALNAESGFPIPREFEAHRDAVGELPPPPAQALIHQWISRESVAETPSLLADSAELFEMERELRGWFFGYTESEPYVEKFQRTTWKLPLLLRPETEEERQERAVDVAIDGLFTPPIRRGYRRRLEELAYIFWKTDREQQARVAVAAAAAITDTGSLRAHPLLRAIVRHSIEVALVTDEVGFGPPPDADRDAYTPI